MDNKQRGVEEVVKKIEGMGGIEEVQPQQQAVGQTSQKA